MAAALDRRQFVGAALATAGVGILAPPGSAVAPHSRPRVAMLFEPGFPAVDVPPARRDPLGAALDGLAVTWLGADDLAALSPERFDVFVSPYGSAFPRDAWPALRTYLAAGGNWVNLGGAPCTVLVSRDGAAWRAEARQFETSHDLGITLACAVGADAVKAWRTNPSLPWTSVLAAPSRTATVWELYFRLSSASDTPDESGSAGPMEGVVEPLVSGVGADGRAVAAPLVMVDRLEAEFAGGRWIFVTADGTPSPATVRAVVEAASRGMGRLEVRPTYACYRDGERPAVSVSFRRSPRAGATAFRAPCRVTVFESRGPAVARLDLELTGTGAAAAAGPVDCGPIRGGRLAPGLYRVEAVLTLPGDRAAELRATNGFWVWDEALLAGGEPLIAGDGGFTRAGRPYPVTGTTYMASDVHRKFLLLPNPWLWDRDFAAMKRTGINLVRTGIWTGWKVLMPRTGAFREDALRALDAWLLTARRHDIPVIFTLFAFLPETWGGANAYLDPQAVGAQQAFVTAIASRYGKMNDVLWDLINEPSFCNPDHLWSCRPNYDRFEREAWRAWIAGRRPPAADATDVDLPALDDFEPGSGADALVRDYRRFAQATFPRWVRQLTGALRATGNPRQLVTVGQDEAGTNDSPNNLFLAGDVDFTCVHNWWLNDALVWDGVMTTAPGRMDLVEETGVMFSGRPPGVEPRWEAYARDLLERKMVISLAQSAGFVEWVWNSNCYMASDNEAAIGLLRADGSAKPELEALGGVAAFAAAAGPHLVGREPEPVLMVVPHAIMFSTRDTATEATRRAVRACVYGCRVGVRAISEYALVPTMPAPGLVVVPADGLSAPLAQQTLSAWTRGGATLVTGAADVARYRRALDDAGIRPAFDVEGADESVLVYRAAFRNAELFALVAGDRAAALRVTPAASRVAFEQRMAPGRAALVLVGRRDGRVIARHPAPRTTGGR